MAGPLTLAVDIDVLLSSASTTDGLSGIAVPEPSFAYAVGERPSAAAAFPTRSTDNLTQQGPPTGNSFQTCHAWLRPGVRRFLLAIKPHYRPVLLVRRRCNHRRCGCCGSSARNLTTDGSSPTGSNGPGGAARTDSEIDIGWCGAALLAAALPHIDPDGQFFNHRVVLVQDQIQPRTAQSRLTRASCPGDAPPTTLTPGGSAVAAAPLPISAASSAAGLTDVGPGSLQQVVRASGLAALPAALGERPSDILVVTVAERSLFGSLAEQVVECQPYRKEYGKYDDVLDCLASVVSQLLAEPSVPQGLLHLGLLHAKLQPSPMMQALHAQSALRQAQQQRRQEQQEQDQFQVQQGAGDFWTQARTEPGSGVGAASGAQKSGRQLQSMQRMQQLQSQQQQTTSPRKASSSSAASTGTKASRKSGGGRRDSDDSGGEERGPAGCRATAIPAGVSASPLPPIPELPFLEVGADWADLYAEGKGEEEVCDAAAPSEPAPGPSSDRSSVNSSASSICVNGNLAQPQSSQPRSLSSSPELCTDSANASGRPSHSSTGSSSSDNSISVMVPSLGASGAAQPHHQGGRRMAWDDVAVPVSPEGLDSSVKKRWQAHASSAGGSSGGVFSRSRVLGAGGSSGRGGGGRGGGELGWRPSSFPAASKPHVTRHISDCASQTQSGGHTTETAAAVAAVAGSDTTDTAPASPLSSAANAMAAATSKLLSRILGGRRQRRCRPSDVGTDSGAGAGIMAAAASVVAAGRSAVSVTQTSSHAWSVTGEGAVSTVLRQERSVSASAAAAPFTPSSLASTVATPAIVPTTTTASTTATATVTAVSCTAPQTAIFEMPLTPLTAAPLSAQSSCNGSSGVIAAAVAIATSGPITDGGSASSTRGAAAAAAAYSSPVMSPKTADAVTAFLFSPLQSRPPPWASPPLTGPLPGAALDDLVDVDYHRHHQQQQQQQLSAPLQTLPWDVPPEGYRTDNSVAVSLSVSRPAGSRGELLVDGVQLATVASMEEEEEAQEGPQGGTREGRIGVFGRFSAPSGGRYATVAATAGSVLTAVAAPGLSLSLPMQGGGGAMVAAGKAAALLRAAAAAY